MKSYLLLSKNKGSGPYSLEQLLQLPLTSADLIWVEGESTVWRTASEIYGLTDLFKQPVDNSAISFSVAANNDSFGPYNKAKRKPSDERIYVSLPAGIFKEAVETTPSLEEKAEALRQKVLNFSEQKSNDTEVKYSRSLHQMKQEYSDWLLKKKKAGRRIKAPLLYSACVLLIPLISFLVLRRQPQKITSNQPVDLIIEKGAEPVAKQKQQNVPLKDNAVIEPIPVPLNKTPQKQEVQQAQTLAKADAFLPINTSSALNNQSYTETNTKAPQIDIRKTDKPIGNRSVTSLFETTSQNVTNNEGTALSVTFQNLSDQIIRSAIVDVFYFDATNKQVGKETLYFGKILPGTSLTKESPPKEAATASYVVDLVSSEKSGLYVRKKSIL